MQLASGKDCYEVVELELGPLFKVDEMMFAIVSRHWKSLSFNLIIIVVVGMISNIIFLASRFMASLARSIFSSVYLQSIETQFFNLGFIGKDLSV